MTDPLTIYDIAHMLPRRPDDGHKGVFGHLVALAGSRGFTGAAKLVCDAANRTGVGLVSLGIPAPLADIMAAALLEPMSLALPATDADSLAYEGLDLILEFIAGRSALVVGPGLSRHPSTARLARALFRLCPLPMVVDADALNAWADCRERLVRRDRNGPVAAVFTPHPGEMARLTGLETNAIQKDREQTAMRFAALWHVVVVLKGRNTVIAAPDGRAYDCPTGNNGLATGGTGDVLAGVIGALLAQGAGAFEAACVGAYAHGLAGDLAAAEKTARAMIARDVIEALPGAWRVIEGKADE